MTKLSDAQLVVLTSACQRDDGLAVLPTTMKPAAAAKLAASLVTKGLVREIRTKPGCPVWREDEDGRGTSLKILKAGRDAIGVEEGEDAVPETDTLVPPPVRCGTKRSLILGLLQRAQGATLDQLIEATGWLPHTTRAALSGLRKAGTPVTRSRAGDGGPSVYRVTKAPEPKAA